MSNQAYGIYRVSPARPANQPLGEGQDQFLGWFYGDIAGHAMFAGRLMQFNNQAPPYRLVTVPNDKGPVGMRFKELINSFLGRSRYYTVSVLPAPGYPPATAVPLGLLWANPEGRNDIFCAIHMLPPYSPIVLYDQRKEKFIDSFEALPSYMWPLPRTFADWIFLGTKCRLPTPSPEGQSWEL